MTTAEKLAEVKKEFARPWYETSASLKVWGQGPCNQCQRWLGLWNAILVTHKISLPEKPSGKGTKALKKYEQELREWMTGDNHIHYHVCTDRPRCRLRKAKRDYRKARLREKEQRRRERALRV